MLTISLILWVCVAILVTLIVHWIQTQFIIRRTIKDIPGPPPTPILGSLSIIMCSPNELWNNLRRLAKEYYPIYKLWSLNIPSIMLLKAEDIEILISSSKHMKKSLIYQCLHYWLGTGLLTSEGSKWHLRRKLLTPAFHYKILTEFLNVFVEQSDLLVRELKKECRKPYIDVVPFITKCTLLTICETAMGTRLDKLSDKQEDYRSAIYRMGDLLIYRLGRPWLYYDEVFRFTNAFREQRKIANIVHAFSTNVIRTRINSTNENENEIAKSNNGFTRTRLAMLDLLISAKKSGVPIDEQGIREEVDTFMFEGHDTTTMGICFALMLLANHRDVQDKVVAELRDVLSECPDNPTYQKLQDLKYLEMVLKECLRMYPSVPFISRTTTEEMRTHSGHTIPQGTYVHVPIYDLHHNPRYFPDPSKFDPDRFLPENTRGRHPFAYIPFSAGPRNCIGQKFAFLELKVIIAKILLNFTLESYDKPEDITLIADLVLRTDNGIRLKIIPRN